MEAKIYWNAAKFKYDKRKDFVDNFVSFIFSKVSQENSWIHKQNAYCDLGEKFWSIHRSLNLRDDFEFPEDIILKDTQMFVGQV